MPKLKIGIIGCGAIGSSLARAVVTSFKKDAVLAALYDKDILRARQLSQKVSPQKNLVTGNYQQLIIKSNLVIEAASAGASCDIARMVLSQGRDIMIMSVGGIIDSAKELFGLAKKKAAQVYLPTGAICGIDALKAARLGRIRKVILTTRKNPRAFEGVKYIIDKGIKLDRISRDTVLFCGPAREAVKFFPQNINVAAILSIAGIGKDKTEVKIIASPKVTRNIHEIQIESDAGRIFSRTENILHPANPKTSYLAVLSAVAALKQILSPVKIGT